MAYGLLYYKWLISLSFGIVDIIMILGYTNNMMMKGKTNMTDTTTIYLHLSHDIDNIDDILTSYPDITIDLDSDPLTTPVTGSKLSLTQLLLDYYYYDYQTVTNNHPQITQSDIDYYNEYQRELVNNS